MEHETAPENPESQGGIPFRKLGEILKTRSPVIVMFIVAGMGLLGWFLYLTADLWILFCVSVFLAYLMAGPVDLLSRKMNRAVAILVLFAVVACVVSVSLVLFIPQVVEEFRAFSEDFPQDIAQLSQHMSRLDAWLGSQNLPPALKKLPENLLTNAGEIFGQTAGQTLNKLAGGLTKIFLPLIILPLTTFYLLKDSRRMHETFVRYFPEQSRESITGLLSQIDRAFGGFIRGRLKLCLVVGTGMVIGLNLAGMKFATVLGIICGICEFIPYIGPVAGAVPVLIVGMVTDKMLIGLGMVLLVQIIENIIFIPMIMSSEMGLHPLVVLFALIAGGQVGGLAGMLISVPLVATVKILLEYYVSNSSHEHEHGAAPKDPAPSE
jgi:predicted PurR-regulated permease PerM